MSKAQTIWMTALWGVVVAMMVGIVATRATQPQPASMVDDTTLAARDKQSRSSQAVKFEPLFAAPDFSLLDQSGKPFTNKDLLGKVWVADFIFTQCGGPCPRMTGKMGQLQDAVNDKDVRFVSFSVDPEHDTPEVLSEYAKRFNADAPRWQFATGPKGAMFDVAHGMRLSALPATADEPISHSSRFLVVDKKGNVVAVYSSGDDEEMKQLVADLKELSHRS